MEFRIDTHQVTGEPMIEVWRDGVFIAGIYSHPDGIKIVSKYLDGVAHESGMPLGLIVNFSYPDGVERR